MTEINKFKWSKIDEETWIAEVPGGWVLKEQQYREVRESDGPDAPMSIGIALCFIPKPEKK